MKMTIIMLYSSHSLDEACSHVAALLFKLEAACCLGYNIYSNYLVIAT